MAKQKSCKELSSKLSGFLGIKKKVIPPDNLGKVRVYCIECKENYKLRYPEFADEEKIWYKCDSCLRKIALENMG